jgi:fatty acyl-ACP thioesterase B
MWQETALNHVGMSTFVGDGMGTTHAMMRHRLIWVVTRMHVEVNRYPVW